MLLLEPQMQQYTLLNRFNRRASGRVYTQRTRCGKKLHPYPVKRMFSFADLLIPSPLCRKA